MQKIQNHIEIKANEIIKKSRAFLEIVDTKGDIIATKSNIQLEIKDNIMYIYAFNGYNLLKTKVNIINNNHINSNICVYAKKFFDIIKVLKNATLFINISENNILTIQSHIDKKKYHPVSYLSDKDIYNKPNYQTSLKGIETSEFNECINNYKIECDNFAGVNKKEFIQILKKSLLFIDKNNYSYNGLFIDVNNNKLDIIATNGSKLIYNTIDYSNNLDKKQFIISYETIQTIIKLYDINKIEDYEILLFNIIDDYIIINSDNIKLISSLHKDIETPKYTYLIKKSNAYIQLNKEQSKELKNYIKSIKKINKDNINNKILLEFSKNKLDVIKQTDFREVMYLNNTINIENNFNYKLYIDIDNILNILDDKELKIYIIDYKRNIGLFETNESKYVLYSVYLASKEEVNYINNIINEHTTVKTQEVKKVSRQVKRFNERKKLKQNYTFIEYTRALNIKDINYINMILSINNLRISEQEKIDLFNRQYNIYKIA